MVVSLNFNSRTSEQVWGRWACLILCGLCHEVISSVSGIWFASEGLMIRCYIPHLFILHSRCSVKQYPLDQMVSQNNYSKSDISKKKKKKVSELFGSLPVPNVLWYIPSQRKSVHITCRASKFESESCCRKAARHQWGWYTGCDYHQRMVVSVPFILPTRFSLVRIKGE